MRFLSLLLLLPACTAAEVASVDTDPTDDDTADDGTAASRRT